MNESERRMAGIVASSDQYTAEAADVFNEWSPGQRQMILVAIQYMGAEGKCGLGELRQVTIPGAIMESIAALALESLARLTANKACSEAENP